MSDFPPITWLFAAVQGVLTGAGALLALMIGASVLVGLRKLRRRGRAGARSLDDIVPGTKHLQYLPPEAPYGAPIDQLGAGTSAGRHP